MRLSGNIKGNNREREKKELQGGSDREARKRRNHRGRRHEYREREKNREDLGWYKVLNWFWGKWKRHRLFHILRSPSTLIITIWWPQCSWSSKSSPCVPCLWKRLHHSLRYSQEPWASLSPLSSSSRLPCSANVNIYVYYRSIHLPPSLLQAPLLSHLERKSVAHQIFALYSSICPTGSDFSMANLVFLAKTHFSLVTDTHSNRLTC